ncbi:MAG: potassium channel family protein [Desulfobacca sp.]|uniref:potassium channel family protein n=1 Tax=Desulfobacca sp. TaxID=2067990 RepID=UPI00404B31DA
MKGKKHICIIGLGQFGMELARELSKNCEVLALDINEELVYAIADEVQRALVVEARDYASLKRVVTADFDEVIVSLGESLESSILCTLHLKKIGVKMIRAKVMSEDHAAILHSLGVQEVIFPERETAWRLAAQIVNPNLLDYIPLEAGYRVMDVAPPNSFYGKTLMELELRKKYGVFVLAVKELVPERFVFLPDPAFVIKPSDVLVMIGREEHLAKLQKVAE